MFANPRSSVVLIAQVMEIGLVITSCLIPITVGAVIRRWAKTCVCVLRQKIVDGARCLLLICVFQKNTDCSFLEKAETKRCKTAIQNPIPVSNPFLLFLPCYLFGFFLEAFFSLLVYVPLYSSRTSSKNYLPI